MSIYEYIYIYMQATEAAKRAACESMEREHMAAEEEFERSRLAKIQEAVAIQARLAAEV
jgi:hypothetical protein